MLAAVRVGFDVGPKVVVFDEPADRIVEIAREKGLTLSRRQLAEWHRHGLIPKPRQLRLGRGKGSESIYPSGTTGQAMTCVVLMAEQNGMSVGNYGCSAIRLLSGFGERR